MSQNPYFSIHMEVLSYSNANNILASVLEGYLQPRGFLNKDRKSLSYSFYPSGVSSPYTFRALSGADKVLKLWGQEGPIVYRQTEGGGAT